MDGVSPFRTITFLVLLLVGAYFIYLFVESRKIPATVSIVEYSAFKKLPPSACHFSAASKSEEIVGDMHAFNRMARFDYVYSSAATRVFVHMIVNDEGMAYAWNDTATTGVQGPYQLVADLAGLSNVTEATCRLWPFPFGDSFVVPEEVSFKQ